jgi:DNA-directed RNA polymerase specialized sigma subunit
MDKLKAHNKKQRAARLERRKEVLAMRKTMTLKQIGDAWGISKQAVWRILQ